MFLARDTFEKVVDSTPLISIDLVVKNKYSEVLLGQRNNAPAQHAWFVPGGRVQKGESLDQAFSRLCSEELGFKCSRDQAKFIGPFEHFYDDSVFGQHVSTHYVVLAYQIDVHKEELNLPTIQHDKYVWFSEATLLAHPDVHVHSKWYFQ